jgi:hypothetical protein
VLGDGLEGKPQHGSSICGVDSVEMPRHWGLGGDTDYSAVVIGGRSWAHVDRGVFSSEFNSFAFSTAWEVYLYLYTIVRMPFPPMPRLNIARQSCLVQAPRF